MYIHRKSILLLIIIIPLVLMPISASSQGEVTCVFDPWVDCRLWADAADIYIDGSYDHGFVMEVGWWADPYTLESVVVHGVAPCQHIPPVTIYEPEHCLKKRNNACPKTPRYYMYTFRDENQPDTWQEYCHIISNNGYPSIESQARICTVPGYDHTYLATKLVYDGWVSTDCHGNASYGWPAWDPSWYRSQYSK
jgi:hypothetical protein